MAKEKTGSDYSAVSNTIKNLLQRKMVRISSLEIQGRKDRKYYALAEKGQNAFINENYMSSKKKNFYHRRVLEGHNLVLY